VKEGEMSTALEEQLLNEVRRLPDDQQQRVLDFARMLSTPRPVGVPGKDLLRFAGAIPSEDLQEIAEAIEQDCERIDTDGW